MLCKVIIYLILPIADNALVNAILTALPIAIILITNMGLSNLYLFSNMLRQINISTLLLFYTLGQIYVWVTNSAWN